MLNPQAAGRGKLNDNSVALQQFRKENEDLRKELELLKGTAGTPRPMRVVCPSFLSGEAQRLMALDFRQSAWGLMAG